MRHTQNRHYCTAVRAATALNHQGYSAALSLPAHTPSPARERDTHGRVDGSRWLSLRLDGCGFSKAVRALRRRVLDGEEPALAMLVRFEEFAYAAGVLDLLFYPVEHLHTLLEVFFSSTQPAPAEHKLQKVDLNGFDY